MSGRSPIDALGEEEDPSLPDDHEERMARAKLSLEGLSVGDAYGSAASIAPISAVEPTRWSYTDDTVMAMAVVRVLRRHGRVEQDVLANEFAADCEAEPGRGYGSGARKLLRQVASGRPWLEASQAAFDGLGSMGNGAAMRAGPIGAYFADDPERAALEAEASAEVTHFHLEARAGAIAAAMAVAAAAKLGQKLSINPISILDLALARMPPSKTKEKLQQAKRLPPGESPLVAARILGAGQTLLAQDTVPFALWIASRHSTDFRWAIESTVQAGGDMDTNCAIVGAIVALSAGRESIPISWLRAREFLKG